MKISDTEIHQRLLRLGEDSKWEFKQIEFKGNKPIAPRRNDLADEMVAFANLQGGVIVCGVTDDGKIQGMTKDQMGELNKLLREISADTIKPPLRIQINHRDLDGESIVIVQIPRGESLYSRAGHAFIRNGSSKRRLESGEQLRIAQRRAQSRYSCFDQQVVPNTGFQSLEEHLWETLLSATGATSPRRALMNLKLLANDEEDIERATIAGILLCTKMPQTWLPYAAIMATQYRGKDRASGQLDFQEIQGPLTNQITDAVKFVVRNMRVSSQKTPAREDLPQYSKAAVFEAVVNAVVHRDYSMSTKRIRLSMFKDRLEIDSPGQLLNGMTIDGMDSIQATRNEVLASVFGRIPVDNTPGSQHRGYMMERRGDGVSIIIKKTREISGSAPVYKVVDESNLNLIIPAAKLEPTPSDATVTVHSEGSPLEGVDVLILFPNKTWHRSRTNEAGEAEFDLHTTHLPMTVYAALPEFTKGLAQEWVSSQGGLMIEMVPLEGGGTVIFPNGAGRVPGLNGRLNPICDTFDRMYLYADNISIEEGRPQPVHFRLGKPLRVTDAYGVEMFIKIVDITGQSSLVEYSPIDPTSWETPILP